MKKTKATGSKPAELPAFEPVAWERFERAVSLVTRAPPRHRPDRRTINRLPPEAVTKLLTVPSDQAAKILESFSPNHKLRRPSAA
jgi:hypothetical protein